MNGGTRADVNFRNGTVNANNQVWTIEDDWTVSGGTFTASTSTVIFDGSASQNSRQEISSNNNPFYNIHISRGTNGGGREDQVRTDDSLIINNDLLITRGGLFDNGFQIIGAIAGQMEINNGARIILGKNGVSTLFPLNYIATNIDLNESGQTRYNSSIAQTISNIPDYGRLYLTNRNANPGFADKILDGPITINDLLFMDDYNNLVDSGFQITGDAGEEIQIDPNSKITLGSSTIATEFPLNFTNLDIRQTSTVVYNSGVNQVVQEISGTGNAQYSNLVINNAASTGNSIKTLEGNIIVRGDLTINSNNELDVDVANNYNIELLGNWTNSGDFDSHQGLVSLTGSTGQTITSNNTEEMFYNLTVVNTDASGITIEDDISVANLLTFSDGVIYEGAGGNELITIEDGANVTGASDASYVDGRVEKIGTIAFDFPVGKNDTYRPISIGAPTVSSTGFRAEYFNTNPQPSYDRSALGVGVDHVSACEYWILDRTTPSGAAAVTLSWSSVSCTIDNLSDLIVSRWDGNSWESEGSDGAPTGNTFAGTVTSTADVTSFSPFTLASISSNNPLPITLISFAATFTKNNTIQLDWITESEINNDYFTIERSQDGLNWSKITDIDGAGNSSQVITYSSIDYFPYDGISYYRLKQTDFDGKFTYSDIQAVNVFNQGKISLYPNPTLGELTIKNDENALPAVEVYNNLGQNVWLSIRSTKMTENEIMLDFSNLPKGIYTIKLGNNNFKILYQ